MLEARLLGQFSLRLDGQAVALASRPGQALLAYLLLTAGAAHRREKLAGLLWPDAPESTARRRLRQALWRIRKAVGRQYLITNKVSIAFDSRAQHWVDALAVARPAGALAAGELMRDLEAYQGELLPGFYADWVMPERERFRAAFKHKMQRLLDHLLEEGRWPAVLDWGERWIVSGSAPEAAYRALMSAHARLGDTAGAANAYRRCVEALRRDLGVEPAPETQALYARLAAKSERPQPAAGHNLPAPLTSFVGRERELTDIKRLLKDRRLVTLAGAGGTGKTRLAIEAAAELHGAGAFADGVRLVELDALSDPGLVDQAAAAVFDIPESPDRLLSQSLADHLRAKQALIVLDNCEHLADACAAFVEGLLRACPRLAVLATSREVLRVPGETVVQVPPLSLPDPVWVVPQPAELLRFEAVRLFCERAAAARPGFNLTPQNAVHVADICWRLDGIPLAIELAAALAGWLPVADMVARLDDVFGLLASGSRTALPRHQTLRAAIDWSHSLLTEGEQALLRRLAVFAGGCTLEAAQAVCAQGDITADLAGLVHKSLVVADHGPGGTRYRLLEVIRQYAGEKLIEAGEANELRDRHLRHFLYWAAQLEGQPSEAEHQAAWLAQLAAEQHNLRTALDWAKESEAGHSLRMASVMGRLWYRRGLIQLGAAADALARAKVQYAAGLLAAAQGDAGRARSLLEESLALYEQAQDSGGAAQCRAELDKLGGASAA